MQEVNVNQVLFELQKLSYNATDPRMDGYYNWENKKKLYQVFWEAQRLLKKCPSFSLEEDWLEEQKQEQVIDRLKGK